MAVEAIASGCEWLEAIPFTYVFLLVAWTIVAQFGWLWMHLEAQHTKFRLKAKAAK